MPVRHAMSTPHMGEVIMIGAVLRALLHYASQSCSVHPAYEEVIAIGAEKGRRRMPVSPTLHTGEVIAKIFQSYNVHPAYGEVIAKMYQVEAPLHASQ